MSEDGPGYTDAIEFLLGLSAGYAAAEVMLAAGHNRSTRFSLDVLEDSARATVDLATTIRGVNEILGGGGMPDSSTPLTPQNSNAELMKIIDAQEKLINELSAGKPVVT